MGEFFFRLLGDHRLSPRHGSHSLHALNLGSKQINGSRRLGMSAEAGLI